jgi:predicted aspartyl protease
MKYKLPIEIVELEAKTFHLFVNLLVGEEHCRMLLDTGASKTVLDSERILRFVGNEHIQANESKSVGLGVEAMETRVTMLNSVKIGKLKVKKMEVAVLALAHVNETYQLLNILPVDGVLGSDFLMKYEATINLRKALLTLRK